MKKFFICPSLSHLYRVGGGGGGGWVGGGGGGGGGGRFCLPFFYDSFFTQNKRRGTGAPSPFPRSATANN